MMERAMRGTYYHKSMRLSPQERPAGTSGGKLRLKAICIVDRHENPHFRGCVAENYETGCGTQPQKSNESLNLIIWTFRPNTNALQNKGPGFGDFFFYLHV